MARRTKRQRQLSFVRRYSDARSSFRKLAVLAGSYTRSLLEDLDLDLHLVTSRAKSTSSVSEKIVRKAYGNPALQLKDAIGVRVITYYEGDVDQVIRKLRSELEIDEGNTVDKRHSLGVREFGYRSVQLIARVPHRGLTRLKFGALRGHWFEIQVRSILEHAWAEIEHEVVYKSEIKYPQSVLRRFASIAGNLEILEREFLALKNERSKLIENYREIYQRDKERREILDVARLLGLLEARYPDGLSWRKAEENGAPFPPRIDAACTRALNEVDLNTAEKLERFMKRSSFRGRVRSFSTSQGIKEKEASHFALIMIAVAMKNYDVFEAYFPDFVGNFRTIHHQRQKRR